MHLIRLGAAVVNQTPLDWRGNHARLTAAIEAARESRVAVLCLPELAISGYGCEDAFLGLGVCERSWQLLEDLLPATMGMAVTLGLPLAWRGAVYNTIALAADGRLVAVVAKRHLAGDGIHYEPRWFKPWPRGSAVEFERGGHRCLLGDLHANLGGIRVGIEICEDAWVADRPAHLLADQAIDLVLNPSASHFAFGKAAIRERIACEGSRALGCAYVSTNLLGNEAGRVIYDGGALIASAGEVVARGPRLVFSDQVVTTAVVDLAVNRRRQARTASFVPAVADRGPVAHDLWSPPQCPPETPSPAAWCQWEMGPAVKEEEFTRAVALGLADYLRKTRSRGFVISLSGGADSAACACLVRAMWEAGEAAHGAVAWRQRCHLDAATSFNQVLTTVYQSTANSGPVTRAAAADLAAGLGASHHEIDVEDLVVGYRARVEAMLGRDVAWNRDDLALQNIQARARAPSVWMLANCLGALLISTSNRSEAAVGYATMDGDTAGGLCPIAGIDKAFLRRWLAWMETDGPAGQGPVPALAAVNRQQPTAELRPQAAAQTDEADLMPYPVLDAIERLAIRDKHPPADCLALLAVAFPDESASQLVAWVRRFFQLWSRNQWKRERYAPSFHLDDENLDPKTWCRFPILSGGFAEELAGLG